MADKIGGYQRPSATSAISDTFRGHQNRTPPSTEPGTDYPCAYGSSIKAPEDGTVVDIKTTTSGGTGRYVTIDFNDGQRGRAIHLSRVLVTVGQKVKRGQEVAKSGASAWGKEWGVGAHVHQTLWSRHAYSFGRNATLDFELFVGADNDQTQYDQDTANRQTYVKLVMGEKDLVIDGIEGDATRGAYERYQVVLKRDWGYDGDIDGRWGPKMQAAHQRKWDAENKPAAPSSYPVLNMDNLADGVDVRGLQMIANLYLPAGRKTKIDGDWGPRSKEGFGAFLRQNWGGSAEAWLRARWGYVGDNHKGPVMTAALNRASAANLREL